jgi:hypothetical protein
MGRVLALFVVTSGLVACSSSKSTCTPGAQVTCSCAGGVEGVQVCNADGQSFGSCQCPGATTGGSTSGSSGGSTTSGTAGSTTSGSSSGGGSGLGAPCDNTNPCPPSAPLCAKVTGTFCTLYCGEGSTTPPGGDAICLDAGAATGTPACVLTTPSDAGISVYFFSCGLLCGQMNGMEYGNCPSQLSCMNNVCQ